MLSQDVDPNPKVANNFYLHWLAQVPLLLQHPAEELPKSRPHKAQIKSQYL